MSTNDTIRDLAARIKADPDDDEAIDALVRAARRRRAVGQIGASPTSVLKYTVAVNERRIQEQRAAIEAQGILVRGMGERSPMRTFLEMVRDEEPARTQPGANGRVWTREAIDDALNNARRLFRRNRGVSPFAGLYQATFPDDDLNRELDSRAAIGERQRLHPATLDIYHPLHAPITRITRLNADDHHAPILGILDESAHPVRWGDEERPDVVDAMVAAHDLARRALPPRLVGPDMPPDLAVIRGANGTGAVLVLSDDGQEERDGS